MSCSAKHPSTPLDAPYWTVNFDEFGYPSSAASWVPEPVVALVLREQGRLGRTLTVRVIPAWARLPEGTPVVDMASFEA